MPHPVNGANQGDANEYLQHKRQMENSGWVVQDDAQGLMENDVLTWRLQEQTALNDRLQANVKHSIFGKEKEDSVQMQQVKQQMQSITLSLREPMAEDLAAFRKQLADMAQQYQVLIENCDAYLGKWGTGRKALVKEVRKAAEKGRICFVNAGASDRIREARTEGMILGNLLGNMETYYETVDTNFQVTEQLKDRSEDADFLTKSTLDGEYLLSKKRNQFDDELRRSQLSTVLSGFLGVENVRRTQLVRAADEEGRKYFGIKRARKFNDTMDGGLKDNEDLTIRQLQRKYAATGGMKLVYSPEALRQLSVVQVMNALLGRTSFDPETDLLLTTQKAQDVLRKKNDPPREEVIHVTGVYMDTAFGDAFHKGVMGSDLKKGKGGAAKFDAESIPLLDREFANAVLAMQPGDLAFMAKNLMTPGEDRAFGSRLKYVQDVLRERLAADEKRPAKRKTVLSRGDWDKETKRNALKNALQGGGSNLYQSVSRIEGDVDGVSEEEAYYDKVYRFYRERIQGAETPEERYQIIADLSTGLQAVTDAVGNTQTMHKGAANQVCTRLMEEFTDRKTLEARQRMRIANVRKLQELYNEKAQQVQEVPMEFINQEAFEESVQKRKTAICNNAAGKQPAVSEEEALRQATETEKERLRYNYIKYLIIKENPNLILDLEQYDAGVTALIRDDNCNRRMKPGYGSLFQMNEAACEKVNREYEAEALEQLLTFGLEFTSGVGVGKALKADAVKEAFDVLNSTRRSLWNTNLREIGLNEAAVDDLELQHGPAIQKQQREEFRRERDLVREQQQAEAQQQAQPEAAQQARPLAFYETLTGVEKEERSKNLTDAVNAKRTQNGQKKLGNPGSFVMEDRQDTKKALGTSFRSRLTDEERRKKPENKRSRLRVKRRNAYTIDEAESSAVRENEQMFLEAGESKDGLRLLQSILEMNVYEVRLTDDASVAAQAPAMENLLSRLAVFDRLDAKNHILETLDDRTKELASRELAPLRQIACYYALRKDIITDPYYRTHYNDEVSLNITAESSPEQKTLAKKMMKAARMAQDLNQKGFDFQFRGPETQALYQETPDYKTEAALKEQIAASYRAAEERDRSLRQNNPLPESKLVKDLISRKTFRQTEGDQLLDLLIADRVETAQKIRQTLGDRIYEKNKEAVDLGLLYSGRHNELTNTVRTLVKDRSFEQDYIQTRNEILQMEPDLFAYRNEEEFKQNFVRNYKRLMAYADFYEKIYGSDAHLEYRRHGLPAGQYNAVLQGRLELLLEIKADYDRRIRLLQGKEADEPKNAAFRMGQGSVRADLERRIEKIGKADAKRDGDLIRTYWRDLEQMIQSDPEKYDPNHLMPADVVMDFMKMEGETRPVPEYTDEELLQQNNLDMAFEAGEDLAGKDILDFEKAVITLKQSPAFANLPAGVQAGFEEALDAYRQARKEHAAEQNAVDVFNEIDNLYGAELSRNRNDNEDFQPEFDRNPYYTSKQKDAFRELAQFFGQFKGVEELYGAVNRGDQLPGKKLIRQAKGLSVWLQQNGIRLTAADPRWAEFEAFERNLTVAEDQKTTVVINFNGRQEELRVYLGSTELNPHQTLTASSEAEVREIKQNLLEAEASARSILANRQYQNTLISTEKELDGTIQLEFNAFYTSEKEKAANIINAYFAPDNVEARKMLIHKRLKRLEDAQDAAAFTDELIRLFTASFGAEVSPLETTCAKDYIQDFGRRLTQIKEREENQPGENKPKSREEQFMEQVRDYLRERDISFRFEAGKQMAEYEQKIKNGEFDGTEYLTEKEVRKVAHDIVHQGTRGKRYMASNQVMQSFYTATEPYVGDATYLMLKKAFEDADAFAAKQTDLPFETARGYITRAEDFNLQASEKGYKVKADYRGGREIFDAIPEKITKLKAKTDEELRLDMQKAESKIDAAIQYETEALKTKERAKELFAEMKQNKPDFAQSPAVFDDFYRELENITRNGESICLRVGDTMYNYSDVIGKVTHKSLDRLKAAADAFIAENVTGTQAERAKYTAMRELAVRVSAFAQTERQRLGEAAQNLGFSGAVNGVIKSTKADLALFDKEASIRKMEVPKREEKKAATQDLSRFHSDEYRSQMSLCYARLFDETIELKKEAGNDNDRQAYDEAVIRLGRFREAYLRYVEHAFKDEKEACLAVIDEAYALAEEFKASANAYIQRKKEQGLDAYTGDEKTRKRIRLIKETIDSPLKESLDAMKFTKKNYAPKAANA